MERDSFGGKMENIIKDNGKMIKETDLELSFFQKEINMKAFG
jgi:hypothetical protein